MKSPQSRVRLCARQKEWLLDQNVLAGLQGLAGDIEMAVVRRGDADDIDPLRDHLGDGVELGAFAGVERCEGVPQPPALDLARVRARDRRRV